jgi:3-deoxy-D-manno-octulosonate 8-phosphate phosphatase (KDO 8-P phosphatase)
LTGLDNPLGISYVYSIQQKVYPIPSNMSYPPTPDHTSLKDAFASLDAATRDRLSQIKLLLMDVDGVLTDGRVIMADDGVESKAFSTRDGFGLVWVKRYGLQTGVISGRTSPATDQRCQNLKLDEIHLGKLKKLEVFESIIQRRDLKPESVAYIGDDIIDLPVMKRCGISACPQDAHDEVLNEVNIILSKKGGYGAVRQFIDLWLIAAGQWETSLKDVLDGSF